MDFSVFLPHLPPPPLCDEGMEVVGDIFYEHTILCQLCYG